MNPLRNCAALAGLQCDDPALGCRDHLIHWRMLSSYLVNLERGPAVVCALILADLHAYTDLGAKDRAANTVVVLRLLLTQFPHLVKDAIPRFAWSHPDARDSHSGLEDHASIACVAGQENPSSPQGESVRA